MSSRIPRLHDLSLCTLFASPKRLPWISGTLKIREPPQIPLMSSCSTNSALEGLVDGDDAEEIKMTKQKLNDIITKFDAEFLQQTLKKDYADTFLLLKDEGETNGMSCSCSWNQNSCIHLPGSLYLSLLECQRQDNEGNNTSSFLTSDDNNYQMTNNNKNNYVNFWIHCSSFAQIHRVCSSLIHFRSKNNQNNIGICIPFPSNTMCGNVLFGMGKNVEFVNHDKQRDKNNFEAQPDHHQENGNRSEISPAQQELSEYEEQVAETLHMLREENIPSSIWLLSGLSCPFGGAVSADPVESSDHVITFIEEFGCNEIFVDDTAGTVHPRTFSDFVKTLIAVSASSSNSSPAQHQEENNRSLFDKISFCFRTSQDNSKLRKLLSSSSTKSNQNKEAESKNNMKQNTKVFAHRCNETILHQEINERIYRNVVRAFSFAQSAPSTCSGLMNFCGSVNTENYSALVRVEGNNSENNKSNENNATFVPLPLFSDWNAELIGSVFEVDPLKDNSETSIEAQRRFEMMEGKLSKNVRMMHKLNEVL